MAKIERPLSPHLQIYKPQITMVTSITHRATGIALGAGTLLLAWWLIAVASGPDAYATVSAFLSSWFGQLVLFGFTWSLFYHLCNGIRHLFWDIGWGLELRTSFYSGMAVLAGTVILTLITWIAGYAVMGGV